MSAVLVSVLALTAAPGHSAGNDDASKDPGRAMAVSVGCDLSRNDVAMNVKTLDRYQTSDGKPQGEATLEAAVLQISDSLKDDGTPFSSDELKAAAAPANSAENPIEVQLPGVSISVQRLGDGSFVATGIVSCA